MIRKAQADADFHAAHVLIAAMGDWDATECDRRGIPGSAAIRAYYTDTAEELARTFRCPRAALFIARDRDRAVGCAAYVCDGPTATLHKLYVDPPARGGGWGHRLLAAALDAARGDGAETARLVTAQFMTDAIRLYEGLGFTREAPFDHGDPPELRAVNVYFGRRL
jgi:ribosomal protein S18 acetylase RimI-like enzyme